MAEVTILKGELAKGGGAEKYALRLAHAFQSRGCSTTLLTSNSADLRSSSGLSIVSYTDNHWFSLQKVHAFNHFCLSQLQKKPTPIVLGLDRNSFQTHMRASNGVHAAYLRHRRQSDRFFKRSTYCINPLHRAILRLEKEAFQHPALEKIFVNSHMVRREVLEFYAVDPSKISVVHNGVEWSELEGDFQEWPTHKIRLAQSLNLSPHPYHFVFIGHNFRRKGLDKLLQGLSRIAQEDFHLSIVGKEKHLAAFKRLAQRLGLEKKVSFWGSRNDTTAFYQLADALIIPSLYDPFANVTVEALAMGVFVVSSRTNGGSEILNRSNGVVIDDLFDPDSIAGALRQALQHPKTEESARARRRSVAYLDFAHQLNQIVDPCLAT